MTIASKTIQLPLLLDSYENIKKFIEVVKHIFPEETTKEWGRVKSNYIFEVDNEIGLPKSCVGSSEVLNFSYGKEKVCFKSISISTIKQEEFWALNYFPVNQDNSFVISGTNVEVVERCEKDIIRLLERPVLNPEQKYHVSNQETVFLEERYEFLDSLPFISDKRLEKVIKEREKEIEASVNNNMPLAAMFLIGSTLEGVLAALAQKYPQKFNAAKSAPKRNGSVYPISSWVLGSLIEVANEIKALDRDVRDFSKQVRNYRNYIHPNEQVKQDFSPTMDTVKISLQVLKAALNQINEFYENNG